MRRTPITLRVALRILLLQALYAIVLVTVLVTGTYVILGRIALEDIRDRTMRVATLAAAKMDGDIHERLVDPSQQDSVEYNKLADILRAVLGDNPDVVDLYTFRRTDNPKVLQFVVDAQKTFDTNGDGKIEDPETAAGLGEPYDVVGASAAAQGFYGPTADSDVTTDKWGSWVSGYAPFYDRRGRVVGIVGVDVAASTFTAALREVRQPILWMIVMGGVGCLLIGWFGLRLFRRANEETLSLLDEHEALIASSPLGIVAVSADGVVRAVNVAMEQFVGNLSAVKNVSFRRLGSFVETGIAGALESALKGQPADQEFECGQAKVCHVVSAPVLRSDSDNKVRGALVVVEDVTTRKQLEARLEGYSRGLEKTVKERTKDLREIQEQYKAVVDRTLIGICVVQNGLVRFANPELANIFGFSQADQIINQPWVSFLTAGAAEEFAKMTEQVVGGALPVFTGRRKDKGVVMIEVLANAITFQGKPAMVYAVRDVTALRIAEEKVRRTNELRNRFIHVVSHQLRTPLGIVRWSLDTVLSGEFGRVSAKLREPLMTAEVSMTEVNGRISDMLTALDIEEGRVTHEIKLTDFSLVWEELISDWQARAKVEGKKITVVGVKNGIKKIWLDAAKIREAMFKLVDNAFVYTPAKGSVMVRLIKKAKLLRFEVADTGIGIPVAEQAGIFDRFYRGSAAAQMHPDSSGLGLALAKYYVELHHGQIGFSSMEGQGSLFWFEIPMVKE